MMKYKVSQSHFLLKRFDLKKYFQFDLLQFLKSFSTFLIFELSLEVNKR